MNKEISVRKLDETKVPLPSWQGEFTPPTDMELNIEIGCGQGWHPIQWAKKNPGRYLVAIEQTTNKFSKFQSRFNGHKLENLLPVHADAISWVTHFVPEESVSNYFILYPNPNPKSCDVNKRWHAMPFMWKLLQTLKPGGTITLATNEEFYYQEAKLYFSEFWKLEVVSDDILTSENHTDFRTHFEKKYLQRGERSYNLVLRK